MDTKPCHQHGREEKANARCDILHIFYGPYHKRYRKNETDHDNFDTLHMSSFLPLWAGISFYDTGGWFCTASTNSIQADDRIVKIDGQTLEGLSLNDAVGLLKNSENDTVTLSIEREGEADLTLVNQAL